jgi:tellurite resistance protein TerC
MPDAKFTTAAVIGTEATIASSAYRKAIRALAPEQPVIALACPLFVALVMVELTDVVFAVDSIPAILAVTRDPFLVFTSNAFAILGLRSLYFAVAGLMAMFRYLRYSLVLILAFVGVKMLLVGHYHVANTVSLAIILGTLGVGILASIWAAGREAARQGSPPPA